MSSFLLFNENRNWTEGDILSPSAETQARNQEFFRAGEISENKGTSINI